MRHFLGQVLFDFLDGVFVCKVAFRDGQNAVFVHQLGVVFLQLVEQDVVFLFHIFSDGGHHEQQGRIAFNMSQESDAQSFAFGSTFDNAGNVGHDETAVSAIADNAEVGYQSGERIICNFGLGRRNHREQCRLACIGEAHQSDISQQLQFQSDPFFLIGFTRLGKFGRLQGGRLEKGIAFTATTAFE